MEVPDCEEHVSSWILSSRYCVIAEFHLVLFKNLQSIQAETKTGLRKKNASESKAKDGDPAREDLVTGLRTKSNLQYYKATRSTNTS